MPSSQTTQKNQDVPAQWFTCQSIQIIVAHLYLKYIKKEENGSIKSRMHWISISNDLFDLFNLRISEQSLKYHNAEVVKWVNEGMADEYKENELRETLMKTFHRLRSSNNDSEEDVKISPKFERSTRSPSPEITVRSQGKQTTSSNKLSSSSSKSSTRVGQVSLPAIGHMDADQAGLMLTYTLEQTRIQERIAKALETLTRSLTRPSTSAVSEAISKLKLRQQTSPESSENEDDGFVEVDEDENEEQEDPKKRKSRKGLERELKDRSTKKSKKK